MLLAILNLLLTMSLRMHLVLSARFVALKQFRPHELELFGFFRVSFVSILFFAQRSLPGMPVLLSLLDGLSLFSQ